MSFLFLGKPHLRVILTYQENNGIGVIHNAYKYVNFKKFTNNIFDEFKSNLKEKYGDRIKINQSMPYYAVSSVPEYIRCSYIDVYFMELKDLASVKIKWKPIVFSG